jgi:hypothetical protein
MCGVDQSGAPTLKCLFIRMNPEKKRYIERAPLLLERFSIQDDIVTYTTKDGAAREFDALEFLTQLS